MTDDCLKTTPLHALHKELGGKMVPFAGYDMPVQYPMGIMAEHLHTREKAGLFDVSHMGQATLKPKGAGDAAQALEKLTPGALESLKPGAMRYTMLLNDQGGILDDFMVTRPIDDDKALFLVVNAGCKEQDFAHIAASLADEADLHVHEDRVLLALQGPKAASVLETVIPNIGTLGFMQARWLDHDGETLIISRAGYTGEDGFEISLPVSIADAFARRLLDHEDVAMIGLGARDSLRLEAGLCLYGHDISVETTPVEAGLRFAIPKSRRARADFPGAKTIMAQLSDGPDRVRVGFRPDDRTIAREGTKITTSDGEKVIGHVTSGGFAPSVGGPVGMGYSDPAFAEPGTAIGLLVRGKVRPARITTMPFIPHNYVRKSPTKTG